MPKKMLGPSIHFLLIYRYIYTYMVYEWYRCKHACIYFVRLTIHGRVSVYIGASGRFQYSPSFELTFSISQCHFWKIDLWPIVCGERFESGRGGLAKNLSSVYCRYLFSATPLPPFWSVWFGFGHTFFRWRLWAIDSHSQTCSITKHIDQFLTIHCPMVLL